MTTTLQYEERQEGDLPATSRTINYELAAEVARDIEAFLAAGGQIRQIPAGVCSEMYRKKMSQEDARSYRKKAGGRGNTTDSIGRALSPWHVSSLDVRSKSDERHCTVSDTGLY